MKLRLTQQHYESFTGQMGITQFVDGLSVDDVLQNVGSRLAAVMNCEWEDGTPANVGDIYLNNMNVEAPVVMPKVALTPQEKTDEELEIIATESAILEVSSAYTEAQLAEIADSKGIAGLREISDPLGIKSNSIRALIDAIMKSPAKAAA